MAQQISGKPMPTAGAYEEQKNNGNRKTDEGTGGAQKGGPGLSRAQSRMPPDADMEANHDSPVEGSRNRREDLVIDEDHSK